MFDASARVFVPIDGEIFHPTRASCTVRGTVRRDADDRAVDVIAFGVSDERGETHDDGIPVGAVVRASDGSDDDDEREKQDIDAIGRTMRDRGVKVWVTFHVSSARAPRVAAFVARANGKVRRVDQVRVILYETPDPPLKVYPIERDEPCAFDRALEDLNRSGRAARERRGERPIDAVSSSSVSPSGAASMALLAIDGLLRALDYKFIASLGKETRWGGGFIRRSVCEVFASACVLRERLRLFRSLLSEGGGSWRRLDRLNTRRRVARAVQITVDLIVGAALARMCKLFDVESTIKRLVVGGLGAERGSRNLVASSVIESNAQWISRGNPLGVKLHVPLARFIGSVVVSFVRTLSLSMNSAQMVTFFTGYVSFLLRHGSVFGASMMLAIAADTMTLFTTHISALHLYSSLFITLQIRCIVFVYRRFINPKTPPRGFEEATVRPRTVEETVVGTLTLPPLMLLLPTVFFYYASYLVLHASTVLARLVMVFAASVLLTFPIDDVLVRFWTPYAFPKSVRLRTERLHNVDFPVIEPTSQSLSDVLRPFHSAAGAWLFDVGTSVARACATCGRFPITLVPWEVQHVDSTQ